MLHAEQQRKHIACPAPAVACSITMRPCIISNTHAHTRMHACTHSCSHTNSHSLPHSLTLTPLTCRKHFITKLCPAPGVEDTGQASTPTQQQPSTLGGSMTSGEDTSLQSSPSLVPPARLGAALHRQRLVCSQPEGSEESGSISSNSSHLVPARFQAGQTASN